MPPEVTVTAEDHDGISDAATPATTSTPLCAPQAGANQRSGIPCHAQPGTTTAAGLVDLRTATAGRSATTLSDNRTHARHDSSVAQPSHR